MTVIIITSLKPVGRGKLNEWFNLRLVSRWFWERRKQRTSLGLENGRTKGKDTWITFTWWICSFRFSRSVVSDSLRPHGLQHSRVPCPSPTPGAVGHVQVPDAQWDQQTKTDLEQRKVYCRATNSQKGFNKTLLKTRWGRGVVNCCKLFCIRILWFCKLSKVRSWCSCKPWTRQMLFSVLPLSIPIQTIKVQSPGDILSRTFQAISNILLQKVQSLLA